VLLGVPDAAAGWECFVTLRHQQRGSDQPSSSIQLNNVRNDEALTRASP
jgi:hypothetical protein